MEPLSVSLSVRSACVLFFHSSPLSLPGKGRNSDFAALGAVGETRPRHTEFYMTLLQRITMMYEGELVPYCAEACLSSLTSSCTHQPPPTSLISQPFHRSKSGLCLVSFMFSTPTWPADASADKNRWIFCQWMKLQQDKTLPMSYDKWVSELSGWMDQCADQCQSSDSRVPTCWQDPDHFYWVSWGTWVTKTLNEQCLTNQGDRNGKLNKCLHVSSSVIEAKLLEFVILWSSIN